MFNIFKGCLNLILYIKGNSIIDWRVEYGFNYRGLFLMLSMIIREVYFLIFISVLCDNFWKYIQNIDVFIYFLSFSGDIFVGDNNVDEGVGLSEF